MAEMRKLTRYFCLLCPESQWNAEAEAIFDDLFHPNLQIKGKHQTFNFQQWKEWYRTSIQNGLTLDMEKVHQISKTEILYTLLVHQDNGTVISHTARGIFQDGKMIATQPADPKIYDIMSKPKRKIVPIL